MAISDLFSVAIYIQKRKLLNDMFI